MYIYTYIYIYTNITIYIYTNITYITKTRIGDKRLQRRSFFEEHPCCFVNLGFRRHPQGIRCLSFCRLKRNMMFTITIRAALAGRIREYWSFN